jgi:ABC-2 type transport system permease protein
MTPLFALIAKEWKLLRRDPGGLIMLFVLPAIFIITLSVALQGAFSSVDSTEKLTVLVINHDKGDRGEKLIQAIADTGYFKILRDVHGETPTRELALAKLSEGLYNVAVVIPEDCSEAVALKKDSVVEVIADPILSKQIATSLAGTIQEFILAAVVDGLHGDIKDMRDKLNKINQMFGKAKIKEKEITKGLEVKTIFTAAGGLEITPTSVQQNVPGWTIFALFWIAQILAVNIIEERLAGSFTRILAAPISLFTYILGKITPFFIINLLQAVVMFAIGVYVLPHLGCPKLALPNLPALAALTAAISLVALSFGLFIAAISRTTFFAASVSISLLILLTILGGIMVPKVMMPAVMQQVARYVPHGWALDGYHNILIRQFTFEQILPYIYAQLAFAAVLFGLALWRFRAISRVR